MAQIKINQPCHVHPRTCHQTNQVARSHLHPHNQPAKNHGQRQKHQNQIARTHHSIRLKKIDRRKKHHRLLRTIVEIKSRNGSTRQKWYVVLRCSLLLPHSLKTTSFRWIRSHRYKIPRHPSKKQKHHRKMSRLFSINQTLTPKRQIIKSWWRSPLNNAEIKEITRRTCQRNGANEIRTRRRGNWWVDLDER